MRERVGVCPRRRRLAPALPAASWRTGSDAPPHRSQSVVPAPSKTCQHRCHQVSHRISHNRLRGAQRLLFEHGLADAVRAQTGLTDARLTITRCESLGQRPLALTEAVTRVAGTVNDGLVKRRFNFVVKVLKRGASRQRLTAWNRWDREALAYRERERLSEALSQPRCYAAVDDGQKLWLWLEDLSLTAHQVASLRDFESAAFELGRFAAASASAAAPLNERPWWSKSWLLQLATLAQNDGEVLETPTAWAPVLTRALGALGPRLKQLRLGVVRELQWLERAPQTLCHGDTHQENLFIQGQRSDRRVIAIDWGLVGRGPLGADAAWLFCAASIWFHSQKAASLAKLDQTILRSTIEGMHSVGWRGSVAEFSTLYYRAAGCRLLVFLPYQIRLMSLPQSERSKYPAGAMVARVSRRAWAEGVAYVLKRYEEVR